MIRLYAGIAAIAVLGALGGGWYATSLKLDTAKQALAQARADATAYKATLDSEREAANRVNQLAEKNLQELQNAKAEIDSLRQSVESGESELHVNAECPEPRVMPSSGQSSSPSNAASPRLSDSARRDYFTLRERHAEATNQIKGLQEYILLECIKNPPIKRVI